MEPKVNKIDFYDIYDYIYVPFYKTRFFIITVIILVFLTLAVLTYFFIKKRKQKTIKIPTPSEIALQALSKFSPQNYETKKEFKVFYFEITKIIKKYLQDRFKLDLIEKTDEELIAHLKAQSFEKSIIKKLEKVLQGSLLIKFANAQALREQAQTDLNTIVTVIKETEKHPE